MKKTAAYILGAAGVLAASLIPASALTTLDLTTAGASGYINGGFFQQVPDQTTGTGVIEPFLRLQKNDSEEGFNTDLAPMPDVKTGTWTHDILLSAIPIVKIAGVDYYQILLDINQVNSQDNMFLTLNELEIYTKTGPLTEANSYDDLAAATKVWDLDVGVDGDSSIELNFDLNPGSGAGDMFAYIPVSALGTDGTKNFYLYSKFGDPSESNDGFEEWAVIKGPANPPGVPDGGTSMALLGIGLAGFGLIRRKLA